MKYKKSSLKIKRKNLFDAVEYEIPFDAIYNKIKVQTIINNNLIVTGIFFLFIGFLFLFGSAQEFLVIFMTVGSFLIVLAFVERKNVITIYSHDENGVELYFTQKNKQDVIDYSNEIINASNNFLFKKYSRVDRSLPIEPQIENLQFLLNRDIISDKNFETLKNQLLGTENKSSIGFSQD